MLGPIFWVFLHRGALLNAALQHRWAAPGGAPWFDWMLALGVVTAVRFIPWTFDGLAFRAGNPRRLDVLMRTLRIAALLEATRRGMGWPLPLITRVGLGPSLVDLASRSAWRHAGGPAKVSVFGSARFGSLAGSSAVNAVTVGSLTIPAMVRVGDRPGFAAAVKAASSAGGQTMLPPLFLHSCTFSASSCRCTSRPSASA